MNKEAIEKLEEALDYKGDYAYNFMCKKIKQALLPEQPNCEGCEHFKHTDKFDHCYRYTEARSLCKLRQEPIEQPPASGEWQGGGKEPERQEWDRNKEQPPAGDCFPLTCKDMYEVIRLCCGLCPWCVGVLGRYVKQESARLDRSKASRKELLTALEMCERARACGQIEKIDKIILQAAIKSNKGD